MHRLSLKLPALLLLLTAGCDHGTTITTCTACVTTPDPTLQTTTLTLSSPTGDLTVNQPGVIHAVVTPSTATGSVELTDITGYGLAGAYPVPLGSGSLQQGAVDFTLTPPNAGLRTYSAVYLGDRTYRGSNTPLEIIARSPASASSCGLGSATYVLSSGSASLIQPSLSAKLPDQSVVCAQNAGTVLNLFDPFLSKSGTGNYKYQDPLGTNAAVLAFTDAKATAGPTINLTASPLITSSGAPYAVFASGTGSTINLTDASVTSTSTITAALGVGNNGRLNVTNSTVTSDYNPLLISAGGTIVLENTLLTSTSESGALRFVNHTATPVNTSFRMTGGSISSAPAVTTSVNPNVIVSGNQTIDMIFSNVDFSYLAQRSFLQVLSPAVLHLTLDHAKIPFADSILADSLTLTNGALLDGSISVSNLTLDASSSLVLHGSTLVQSFSDPGGISGTQVLNITGNGQNIYYSRILNPQLGGLTYSLKGSGSLVPH